MIIGGEYEDAEGMDSCVLTRDWCRNLPGIVTNPDNRIPGQPRNIITKNVVLGNMTSAGMIRGSSGEHGAERGGFRGSRVYGIQFDAGGNPIPFTYGLPVNRRSRSAAAASRATRRRIRERRSSAGVYSRI